MKTILGTLGRIVYWLAWPALWVYLYGSTRTRLLLVCNNEVLVLRGWLSNGEWSLPGGGLHAKEDPVGGLIREVKEETGIVLTADQLISLGKGQARQQGFRFNFAAFVCTIPTKPALSFQKLEISHARWLPIDQIDSVRTDHILQEVVGRWRAKG